MYYKISHSTGKEVGRVFPQLHCLTQPYAHSLSAWEFPNFTPKLDFELNKSSKLTDVLSNAAISANGLIISEKVKDILDSFNLMTHKYFDLKVRNKKEEYRYFWIHLCDSRIVNMIDYDNSIFFETEYEFRKDKIVVKSFNHYLELKSHDKDAKFGVDIDKIVVKGDELKDLDLFLFLPFNNEIYITRQLKDAFDSSKITGIEIFETDDILIN